MTIKQIINQLRKLLDDRKSLINNDSKHDDIYIKDINALECAISAVEFFEKSAKREERTAHWDISCDGYYPYCSACRKEPPGREMTAYCPNCGRRMVTPERRKI